MEITLNVKVIIAYVAHSTCSIMPLDTCPDDVRTNAKTSYRKLPQFSELKLVSGARERNETKRNYHELR